MTLRSHPYYYDHNKVKNTNSHYPLICKATDKCNVSTKNWDEFIAHIKQCPAQKITRNCPMCRNQFATWREVNRHIAKEFTIGRQYQEEKEQREMQWEQSHDLVVEPANTTNDDNVVEPANTINDDNVVEPANTTNTTDATAENTDLNPEATDYDIALGAEMQKADRLKHQFTHRVLQDQHFAHRIRTFEIEHLLQLFLSNAISMTIFTVVITLIHGVCDLIVDRAIELIQSNITLHKLDVPEAAMKAIEKSYKPLRTPFESMLTSYKTNKTLARSETYSAPVSRQFESRPHTTRQMKSADKHKEDNIARELEAEPETYMEVDIQKNIELVFGSNPEVYDRLQGPGEKGVYTCFADGDSWRYNKLRAEHPDRTYIALSMAYDDITLTDKNHRKQGVYALSICNLPGYYSSTACGQMFMAQAYTEDWTAYYKPDDAGGFLRERQGYEIFHSRASRQFTTLETNGMDVNTLHGTRRVYPTLALVQGDNLAVHCLLNFCQNFTACKYQCVLCMITVDDLKRKDISIKEPRGEELYNRQVQLVENSTSKEDFKKNVTATGVYGKCHLETTGWAPWNNNYLDVMHDVDEGSPHVLFHQLLCVSIRSKLITKEQIQTALKDYKWGPADWKNKTTRLNPDALDQHHDFIDKHGNLKEHHVSLGLKAAEFYSLIVLFPAIFPPSLFDRTSPQWQAINCLRSIVMFLHANYFTDASLLRFGQLYEKFLELAKSTCGAKHTIKTHNVQHYASLFRYMGPGIQRSSYPLERCLGHISRLATTLNNFKNLPKSSAVRFMQKHSIRLANGEGNPDKYIARSTKLKEIPNDLKQLMTADQIEDLSGALLSPKFKLRGTEYQQGEYLMLGGSYESPRLAEIMGLVVNSGNDQYTDTVLVRVVEHVAPNPDCTSSRIVNPEITTGLSFTDIRNLRYYHPMSLYRGVVNEQQISVLYLHSDSMWVTIAEDKKWTMTNQQ